MVQDVVFHTECCTDVVLLDQIGGVHPEGLGEFADRAPLGRHLVVGLQVEHSLYREKAEGWVDDVIAEMLDTDNLKKQMVEEFQERFGLEAAQEWIEKGFEDDLAQSWREVLRAKLEKLYEDEHKDDLRDSVREYVKDNVAGNE